MAERGNQTENSSLVSLLMSVKKNVFRTLNVAELFVVTSSENGVYQCEQLNSPDIRIECIALQELDIQNNDCVLVLFSNSDFKASLNQFKAQPNSVRQTVQQSSYHDIKYGIIIGRVWPERKKEK